MRCPGQSAGYTLIELITVLVILGVLAAVAVPKMFDRRIFLARGYADELAATLRYAQSVAAASGCDVQVTINAAGYSAYQHQAAGNRCQRSGPWSTPVLLPDGAAVSGATPTNVTVAPAARLRFDAQGGVAGAAAAPIRINGFALTIDAVSGYVQLQ